MEQEKTVKAPIEHMQKILGDARKYHNEGQLLLRDMSLGMLAEYIKANQPIEIEDVKQPTPGYNKASETLTDNNTTP